MFVLVAVLSVQAYWSVSNDRQAISETASKRGYWIARALELGYSGLHEDEGNTLRDMIKELGRQEEVVLLALIKPDRTVLAASDETLQGSVWPDSLMDPKEHGRVIRRDRRTTVLSYAAGFEDMVARLGITHLTNHKLVLPIKWIVVSLDTTEAYAHYRSSLIQSILMVVLTAGLAVAAVFALGLFQRNLRLEQIKQGLQRFVPGTVQQLIEDDPENPKLDKVECEASIAFLDIEGYTQLSERTPPAILNRLVEKYFSAFFDTIISYGGEINETAGDGIMVIFTGETPADHARNAVSAALAIRAQTNAMNAGGEGNEPKLLVNIGINSGLVLIGATTIKGTAGEHHTYTASGSVTNLAARLCELGVEGEICVSAATANFVGRAFKLDGPRMTTFKNVHLPIPIYRAI